MTSIHKILLNCLNGVLIGEYKDAGINFISLSHKHPESVKKEQSTDSLATDKANASQSDFYRRISVKPNHGASLGLYGSAVPHMLLQHPMKGRHLSIQEYTEQVLKHLQKFQSPGHFNQSKYLKDLSKSSRALWGNFKITSTRPGWIEFQLSSKGLFHWLSDLQNDPSLIYKESNLTVNQLSLKQSSKRVSPLTSIAPKKAANSSEVSSKINQLLWQTHYSHSRCQSLLTQQYLLAAIAANKRLHQPSITVGSDGFQSIPNPSRAGAIPTASENSSQLSNDTSATYRLVQALLETVDAMFWIPYRYPSKQYFLLLKRGGQLCQAFDRFQRTELALSRYSIPESEATPNHQQNQIVVEQVLLVTATKNVLKALLEGCLHEKAADEL